MSQARTIFMRRRHAYQRIFRMLDGAPLGDAAIVLADLKRFARLPDAPVARSSLTGATDALATGVLIGRQEAVNRILAHLHVDERAFFNLRDDTDD